MMKPLEISDYPKLKRFFNNPRYRLCEYSLPSILAWTNDEYRPYGMIDEDALIVAAEFTQHKESRHLMLPVSPQREYTPEELQRLAVKLGYAEIWFVPEDYLDTFGKSRVRTCFKITRQKGFDDYVYLAEDLIHLAGNKYSKKRNLVNQFKKTYLRNGSVQEQMLSYSNAEECIDFLERWCEAHHCDVDEDSDMACEKQAAIHTIENIELLGVNGLLLKIDGEVSAFAVASHMSDDMGVLHFEKAYTHIKGLYQYFDQLCAGRLLSGYRYINKESDMDVAGLAKAKKSYHPVSMIKSYKLTLK
ncbi:DUF2156 domain-containing protein [Thermodesulfobacteriota bacterium]